MAADGKITLSMHYFASKRQFIAHINQGKSILKTKTVSHGDNKTPEAAYKEMTDAARLLCKEWRCDYVHKPQETLMKLATKKKARRQNFLANRVDKEPSKLNDENPLVTKFGNELAFKAMIKHSIKLHGLDKVSEVLTNALALTKEMKADIEKRTSAISSANIKIARIIVETRQGGIDMASPSKEIDAAIAWVIENDSKPKGATKGEANGNYQLNGEKWNGTGHAPASFSKYLQQNENHSLDDLRVN